MPELCRFHGLIITMYYGDHPPPHFHVSYGRHNAQVLLDGTILAGALPPAPAPAGPAVGGAPPG